MTTKKIYSLGIIGVRGYVGKELLALLLEHPQIETKWLSSRQLEGQSIDQLFDHKKTINLNQQCIIKALSPEQVAEKETDIIVLALPNGLAEPYVKAIEAANNCRVIIDLSADYRFTDEWIYSLPELDHVALSKAALNQARQSELIKISNPGCYASAMQLALAPIIELLSTTAHCFGISGYSGAGTKPSIYNDPEKLKNNIIGYKLIEHLHEKEVSHRLNHAIRFSPSVAEFFRGINMTIQVEFAEPQNFEELITRFQGFYQDSPLVSISEQVPVIQDIVNTHSCHIGGLTLSEDGKKASLISCLDNLLKGAATQAIQNINLALKLDIMLGLDNNVVVESHNLSNAGEH